MPFDDALSKITSSDTLETVAYLTGGYLVTEQVTRRVLDGVAQDSVGFTVPDEAYGVLTAAAFYGYGDRVVSSSTATMMGHGALLNSVDEVSNRPQIRELLNTEVSE
jgi:hypothetical protein